MVSQRISRKSDLPPPRFSSGIPEPEGLRKLKQLRILVVEDNDDLREMVCEGLKFIGHSPSQSADGLEGLERVKSENFDIVVSDFHMPKMSGLEMLREIKKRYPELPVIMAFSEEIIGEIDLVKAAGASAVLQKPFGIDELQMKIDVVLGTLPTH